MIKNFFISTFFLGFFCQIVIAQTPKVIYIEAIDTDELIAKEGQRVVVYGETAHSGKSKSGMNFVNFKNAIFTLVTFKSDLAAFKDGEPADIFDGKKLAVKGVISIYRDKPQIKLTDPGWVTVLTEDEVFPPETKAEKPAEKKKASPKAEPEAKEKAKPVEPKKKPPVDPKKYFK